MNYRLTDNKKIFNGETLFQIECIEDCKYAKVGELGGYIASYDNLADGAWVNKDVCVCDTSVVKGYVENGFVAGGSIVNGKVCGIIIRNSFIDEDTDLDSAIVIHSNVYGTKAIALKHGEYNLSFVSIFNSSVLNSELKGQTSISDSIIDKSLVEWQNIESLNIEEGYSVEYYESDDFEETGELYSRRIREEKVTQIDSEVKSIWESFKQSLDEMDEESLHEMYHERNTFSNEQEIELFLTGITNMEEYYNRFFGEELMSMIKVHLSYHDNSLKADMIQNLNEMGYQCI